MTAKLNSGTNVRGLVLAWLSLVASTFLEVLLAYRHSGSEFIFASLLLLALINGYFIVAFFMHLREERGSLILTLVPMTIYMLVLLTMFVPDGIRLHLMNAPLH